MRKIYFGIIAVMFLVLLSVESCKPAKPPVSQGPHQQPPGQKPVTNEPASAADQEYFLPAENLVKRTVLYKLGMQEGDLAPFTAKVEEVQNLNFPAVTRDFIKMWWSIDWGQTRLAPLPINEMTGLERTVFPMISARLDEGNKDSGWCLYTLSYRPQEIRVSIANAHTNWPPEERDIYIKGTEPGCLQVWCGRVSGEWKILMHITCTKEVIPPEPPAATGQPSSPPESNRSAGQTEDTSGNTGNR